MYAGEFAKAASCYENALKQKPDQPLLLCQAAMAWIHAGEFAKAERPLQQATEMTKKLPPSDPVRIACAHIQCILAVARAKDLTEPVKRLAEGHEACLKAVSEKTLGEDHPLVGSMKNNLAVAYVLQAKYPEAQVLFQGAEQAFGQRELHLAAVRSNLAAVCLAQADFAKAEEMLALAGAVLTEGLPEDHPVLAITQNLRGLLRHAAGNDGQAVALAEGARDLVQNGLGPDHASILPVLDSLADIYTAQARYAKADEICRRRVLLADKLWGTDHPFVAEGLIRQAIVYILQARYAEAETICQRAEKIESQALGPKSAAQSLSKRHPSMAALNRTRARLEIASKTPEDWRSDARRRLEGSQRILEALYGKEQPDHPDLARTLGDLASLCSSSATVGQGVTSYGRAIGMLEKSCGADHPDVAKLLCGLAVLYQQQEKWDEAKARLDRALVIQRSLIKEKMLRSNHPDLATTLETYAALLEKMPSADPDRAAELRGEAKAIRDKHAEEEQAETSKGK
jgi:tetratricopeptide (TPR) repeat protein